MDHFGIGAALIGAAEIYFQSARGTGRTTSLLESLRDGDRVVCHSSQEASRLRHLMRERNLKVDVIAINPANPEKLFEQGHPQGRTLFDHVWVEQRYANALRRCAEEIDNLQRQASGYGEAHHETRQKARELRWVPPLDE